MVATEDRLVAALEEGVEDLAFHLDAAGMDFEVTTSPNMNQYIVIFADGTRHAYVTAELVRHGIPAVFIDVYSVSADGDECLVLGDMTVAEAATYIINA
nr:MAG TPA: hypothetical protein [Caudoviricetes sp.]